MTLESAPVMQDPEARQAIEYLVLEIQFLRCDPDRPDAPETRRIIAETRRDMPDIWEAADAIVRREHAAEDALRERPGDCPRCHGTGKWKPGPGNSLWDEATASQRWNYTFGIACSCPIALAMERGVSLEQDSYDRGITAAPPPPPIREIQFNLPLFVGEYANA